jgi:hypothetical protein
VTEIVSPGETTVPEGGEVIRRFAAARLIGAMSSKDKAKKSPRLRCNFSIKPPV